MNKIYLYIGSNNTTKKLEANEAKKIISQYFDGFTAYEVIGYWKGHEEKTLKVEIITGNIEDPAIIKMVKELKLQLDQEAILIEKVISNCAFI